MLRYMDGQQTLEAVIQKWEKDAKSMKEIIHKEAVEAGFPALAEVSLIAYQSLDELVEVLRDMNELLYSDNKKVGKVTNIFTREVIA